MQCIKTKYLGPTNMRGSRVKASTTNGISITLGWQHEYDSEQNHAAAAWALASKMNWHGDWFGGCLHGGGYVFVCTRNNTPSFRIANLSKSQRLPNRTEE